MCSFSLVAAARRRRRSRVTSERMPDRLSSGFKSERSRGWRLSCRSCVRMGGTLPDTEAVAPMFKKKKRKFFKDNVGGEEGEGFSRPLLCKCGTGKAVVAR